MGVPNAAEEREALIEGIQRSWDLWLADREVSLPKALRNAIASTFAEWLDANRAELLASITKACSRRLTLSPAASGGLDELRDRLVGFMDCFELVFRDDWDHTKSKLRDESIGFYVKADNTFLDPGVDDESNNWWNRGALLSASRSLVNAMGGMGWTPGVEKEEETGDSK